MTCRNGRTDPNLWKKAKQKAQTEACRSGTRRCGTWDARMAQRAGKLYRDEGGGYCGARTKAQKSLRKWTREDWTTESGEKACRQVRGRIICDRYLPKKAWQKLTPSERKATQVKKRSSTAQFVPNTPAARRAKR